VDWDEYDDDDDDGLTLNGRGTDDAGGAVADTSGLNG